MTDQQPHTPTLAAFRYAYVEMRYQLVSEAGKIPPTIEERVAEYDRGVAVIEAAAEQRGKEQGWDEGYKASDHEAYYFSTHGNTENPYRADQEENNEPI